jgi:hypothetical protein
MSALRQQIREHHRPLTAVAAASGAALVFAGVGAALAAAGAVGGICILERARRSRDELTSGGGR